MSPQTHKRDESGMVVFLSRMTATRAKMNAEVPVASQPCRLL